MKNACDWCCPRCGGSSVTHFYGPDGGGRKRWQNRCTTCGVHSEYLPTLREIERECRRIRAAAGLRFDDDQEKLWRRATVEPPADEPSEHRPTTDH